MATRDPFDYFYAEVLRLPPGMRDPDHYTLLGLAYFEKSEDRIRRAGHDRKRALRRAPKGEPRFEHVRRELIERVREARRVLLDGERRDSYDAFLIGRGGAPVETDFRLADGAEFAGRYRILQELRRGGFDRIYAALDRKRGQRVELTVLPPAASHDAGRRRRAVRAAHRLRHFARPGVIGVLGLGEAEGLVFAAWSAPAGVSLSHHVRRNPHGRLDPEEAARLATRLAALLADLHARDFAHGDLNARNVFVNDDGEVEIGEYGLAAAASADVPTSPYSAPEREVSPAADRYALGALVYFLLQGEAPFLEGRRALVPKPLPDDVPLPLARTVLGLLAREPSQRPESPRFELTAKRRRRRMPWVAALGLAAVVSAGVFLARGNEEEGAAPVETAWELIAERRFAEAIDLLEAAPDAPENAAPMASALEGEALRRETDGDPYAAQSMLERAQALASDAGRGAQLDRIRALLVARLDAVAVTANPVTRDVVVRIEAGDAALARATVDGAACRPGTPLPVDRAEGEHRVPFELEDRAGNRRSGFLEVVVDRTAPVVTWRAPEDGRMQRSGSVEAVVAVDDAHPSESVTIHGRTAPLDGGEARLRLNLPNGRHALEARAVDRAGNEGRATVSVTVDDRAPEIRLERTRIVSQAGEVVVRGRVLGLQPELAIDGVPVEVGEDGRFAATVRFDEEKTLDLVARGSTGVVQRASVQCVRDTAAPEVELVWSRRDADGRILYGGPEMEAGVLPLRVRLSDDTAVRAEVSEGEVKDGTWRLAPHEGERVATIRAIDEAGNATAVEVRLAGHRSTPRLEVGTSLGAITRDAHATLTIDADDRVLLGDRPVEAGRVEVPLAEGEQEIVVRAVDVYGNESAWRHRVLVDRTPPVVRVVGSSSRGVGRQNLVLESDEALTSITCLSQVKEDPPARQVAFDVDLEAGRTQIHVVAKDRAGNIARLTLPLQVVNRVLLLDGKSAVRVPLDPIEGDMTVEFWARGTPAIDPAVMVSRGVGKAWQVVWASEDEALPHVLLHVTGEGPSTLVTKKMRDALEWHHYAFVRDGRKLRFFLDGRQQEYLESRIALTKGERQILIGGSGVDERGRVENGFIGRIDELRVSGKARYNRAFRPARFMREDGETLLLLRFDLVMEKDHPDTSGKGRHGKPVGEARLVVAQE